MVNDYKDAVWCNVEIGVAEQTVHCPGGDTYKVPVDYLAASIAQTCYHLSKKDILLFGPLQYINMFRNEIMEYEQELYGLNNLNVICEGEI